MKFVTLLLGLIALAAAAPAAPVDFVPDPEKDAVGAQSRDWVPDPEKNAVNTQSLDFSAYTTEKRADSSLVGYLGAFFLGNTENVYFYLSNGNSATSFSALNGGSPVLVPTLGTRGVRDPSIVAGGGSNAGRRWYMIGTDLKISATTWDQAQRQGSRGIFVWESTDLVHWTNERLVTVEDGTAGMVWAPEAIWDATRSQYFVYWSSKFYPGSDSQHTGSPTPIRVRYAYTTDFRTFTAPADWINYSPASVIDADILPLDNTGRNFARFVKNETATNVFTEISTSGLFGTWTRPGGSNAIISASVEGPASFWDNQVSGRAHLLLDFFGGNGYAPYESTNVQGGAPTWKASSTSGFPSGLRHGSVLPINQTLYDRLNAAY